MSEDAAPLFESRLESLPLLHRGKVRDLYAVDDERLLIVATDRLSAYDVVLPDPIPGKGAVLTRLARFWLERTRHIAPNHLLDEPPEALVAGEAERAQVAGRAMVVRRTRPLPVEAIARGYLAGSGWQAYRRTGTIAGVVLPAGLREAEALPEAVFTPTTKASGGAHDAPITFEELLAEIGADAAERVREVTLAIYREAAEYAAARGVIIADTKLELGRSDDGELLVIDELLTPDSSRFWPADAWAPGRSPPSFDKQFVRDHLDATGWDRTPPAPHLPEEVIRRTAEKYREAERRLIG